MWSLIIGPMQRWGWQQQKYFFSATVVSAKSQPGQFFQVVQGLTYAGTSKGLGEILVACCHHFADKIDWIRVDLNSRLVLQNLDTPSIPSGPHLWTEFLSGSTEDVDRCWRSKTNHQYTRPLPFLADWRGQRATSRLDVPYCQCLIKDWACSSSLKRSGHPYPVEEG